MKNLPEDFAKVRSMFPEYTHYRADLLREQMGAAGQDAAVGGRLRRAWVSLAPRLV
jgi:hypothetical protein